MKKTIIILGLSICSTAMLAQNIGINSVGSAPDASAMLDVSSTNSGMLIPRVSLVATNNALPVTAPATSLLVYNTATAGSGAIAVTPGFYYWNSSAWIKVIDASSSSFGTDDQNLTSATLSGTTLQINIENGAPASVSLASLQDGTGTDSQTLSLSGNTLYISGGNNITLIDNVNDADANPTNEIQTLAISGNSLSIAGGNSVTLPSSSSTSYWNLSGSYLYNNSGNRIGINTSSPNYQLDVSGDARATNLYVNQNINHTGDANTYIGFVSDDIKMYAGGLMAYQVDEGSTDRTYINSDIITFNEEPGNAAYIEMDFRDVVHPDISPYQNYRGYLGQPTRYWQGGYIWNVFYNNLSMTSDARVKENVHPIDSSIEKLMKVNTVTYDYIPKLYYHTDNPTAKQIEEAKGYSGVLAQEFEKVFPGLVNTPENPEEYKSVNYVGLIPYLLKAIQEQQLQIDSLTKKMAE